MALSVFYTLLQLLLLLALGFWLARARGYPRELFQGLNRFLASVALPLYFFTSIAKTDPADMRTGWVFPIVAACIILVGLAVSIPLFKALPFTSEHRRAGVALSVFGNSGYIPLGLMEIIPVTMPFIAEKFNPQTASLYIGTYLLVNSPLLWTLGNWLVAGTGKRPRLAELFPPPFIGIIAGLSVVGFGLQPWLFDKGLPFFHAFKALEKVGGLTLPLIMITLGAMISELGSTERPRRELIGMAATVSAVRFLVMPGLFVVAYLFILRPLAFTPVQCWVVFLEMTIPPATNLSIMAGRAHKNEEHVSFTLMVTYLLFLAVLPAAMYMFLSLTGM
jgi:predicted permease